MQTQDYLAVDLGASSGRGIIGKYDGKKVVLNEIGRFGHDLNRVNQVLYWDILHIYRSCKKMIGKFYAEAQNCAGIGIDSWALDYGLIDKDGNLLGNIVSYRNYTEDSIKEITDQTDAWRLFSITGAGSLPFNTVYQLYGRVLRQDRRIEAADRILLLPDLLMYFLTGVKATEYTNAATTMMLDCKTRAWSKEILNMFKIPERLFTEIVYPCTLRGRLTENVRQELGVSDITVYNAATHDTASAVAAIKSDTENEMYISNGTWALIGMETGEAVLSRKAFDMGFSNEGTLQGTYRLNKNVMGLGLIEQCKREWEKDGRKISWDDIVGAAKEAAPFTAFLDPDDLEFFDLQDIERKVRRKLRKKNPQISTRGEIARCIYESLAMKYRYVLEQLELITGRKIEVVHIVGGGCRNALLNQFTANAVKVPVAAGPAEGASMANVLAQAMAAGEIEGMSRFKEVIAASTEIQVYMPQESESWDAAYGEFLKTISGDTAVGL